MIEGEANRINNSILEENSFLQSNQIKDIVDESIKVSIKELENRFMAYIQSIEAQIGEIKSTNEEIIRLKLRASNSSDSKGSVRSEEALRKANNWPLNIENQQFFRHSETASVSSGKKDPSSEMFNLPENSSMKKK